MNNLIMTLLEMSLKGSFCIGIIFIVRLFLKKVPKKYSYYLWLIVFLQLIFPYSIESEISLQPHFHQNITSFVSDENQSQNNPILDIKENNYSQQTSVVTPQNVEVNQSHQTLSSSKSQLSYFLMVVWLTGFIALIIKNIYTYVHLQKSLQDSSYLSDNIYLTDHKHAPFVFGIFTPKIYIPQSIQKEDSDYILFHERMHIKRKDHLVKLLTYTITCIHWFNPLVWLAYCLMSKDMELSCDEAVIEKYAVQKKDYAKTLLTYACQNSKLSVSPIAFGEGNVQERIKNILHYKKTKIWLSIGLVTFIIGLSMTLLTSPQNKASSQLSYQDPNYLKDIYESNKKDHMLDIIKQLDYGKDYTFKDYDTSFIKDGNIRIVLSTSQELSFIHQKNIMQEEWKYNALVLMALNQDVDNVQYCLNNNAQQLFYTYSLEKTNQNNEINDLSTLQKTIDNYIKQYDDKVKEIESYRFMDVQKAYQKLQPFIPYHDYKNINGVQTNLYTDENGTYIFYMFAKYNDSTDNEWYDYNIQMSFSSQGLVHYAFKVYNEAKMNMKPIDDSQAQELVNQFVKTYRLDANELHFQKKAVLDNHIYDEGHIESWVATSQSHEYIIMVNKNTGSIQEASFNQ